MGVWHYAALNIVITLLEFSRHFRFQIFHVIWAKILENLVILESFEPILNLWKLLTSFWLKFVGTSLDQISIDLSTVKTSPSKTDNIVIQELVCQHFDSSWQLPKCLEYLIIIKVSSLYLLDWCFRKSCIFNGFLPFLTKFGIFGFVFAIFSFWNPWTWNYKSVITLFTRLLFAKKVHFLWIAGKANFYRIFYDLNMHSPPSPAVSKTPPS